MDQCMSFNIDKDDYKMFIKNLRKLLLQSTSSHGILVLMPQSGPLSWLDVELIVGDCKITLRADRRTLYVRGYSRNGDTHFWEFYDDDWPLIPGSRSLGYSGSYVEGLTSAAGIVREHLPLGHHPLQNAISNLAVMENPTSDQVQSARSLLTMIQMITEAARIELIAERIVQNWWNAQPINLRMVELENAWGTPSCCEVTFWSRIHTLVSIEFVRVKSINSESPGELYGTVMVEDCWGSHAVYERCRDNAENKGPGDCISLTGPCAAISGADAFTISVSLWDHDNEIAKGDVLSDPRYERPYNIIQVEDVSGEYGSVSVAYSVMTKALSATVAAVLINGDGESPIDVYGTIKAMIDAPQYHSDRKLFDKSEDEYIQVRCQEEFLPLTHAVFPARVNSYVTIQANLWGHDILLPCDQIFWSSVHFTPTLGTQHKIITGKYGKAVKVSITCE